MIRRMPIPRPRQSKHHSIFEQIPLLRVLLAYILGTLAAYYVPKVCKSQCHGFGVQLQRHWLMWPCFILQTIAAKGRGVLRCGCCMLHFSLLAGQISYFPFQK